MTGRFVRHAPRARRSFRVEVLVSDRWMTLDGADALPQHEAHTLRAQEAEKAGQHRVRTCPNAPKKGNRS